MIATSMLTTHIAERHKKLRQQSAGTTPEVLSAHSFVTNLSSVDNRLPLLYTRFCVILARDTGKPRRVIVPQS